MSTSVSDCQSHEAAGKVKLPKDRMRHTLFWSLIEQVFDCHHVMMECYRHNYDVNISIITHDEPVCNRFSYFL